MNRLKEPPDDGTARPAGEYFVVSGESWTWYVSAVMARHLERGLDAKPRRRWLTFVDLSGARIRIRRRAIDYIAQSTPDQRAIERRFFRSLRQERKADRSWGDDDEC